MTDGGSTMGGRLRQVAGGKFVRDTVVLQFGMAVTMATYMFTSVLLARGLGPHDFGRYTLAFSLYSIVFFLGNVGVTTASVSDYAKAVGRRDAAGKVDALAAYLKAFVFMCAAILLLGAALPAVAAGVYDDRDVGIAAWLLCLLGPTQMLNGFILVALQGARRMKDYVLYDNACGVLRLIVLLFAVLGGAGVMDVVWVYLGTAVLSSVLGLRMYHLVRADVSRDDAPPPLGQVIRAAPRARVRGLFSAGTLIAISKNANELVKNFTNAGIARAAGSAELAHFRVAFIYLWALQQLLGGLSRNLLPSMGVRLEKHGGDMGRFGRDLWKVAFASGLLFILVTAFFVVVAPFVLGLLYGPAYRDSVGLVALLAIGHLALGFHVVIDVFYIYTRQLAFSTRLNLALLAFIVVPMGYVLITRFGVTGAAIFLSASQFVPIIHLFVIARWFRRRRTAAQEGGAPDDEDQALPAVPGPE